MEQQAERRGMCSLASIAAGEDPGGTAGAYGIYLLVETPFPWERDIVKSPHFPPALGEAVLAAGAGCRVLGIASARHASPQGMRRMIVYRRPDGPFARFEQEEYVVPHDRLAALAAAVLAQPRPAEFAEYRVAGAGRNVFVCTHGRRDRCCGLHGYAVYEALDRRCGEPSESGIRVWRVSHIGGHRLAPTLIDFPSGRFWAHVRPERLEAVLEPEAHLSDLAAHYRGWGGLRTPEQLLEREAWLREGAGWADYLKTGSSEPLPSGGVRATVEFRSADGSVSGVYEGIVRETAPVAIIGCDYHEPEWVPQYRVEEIVRRPAAN